MKIYFAGAIRSGRDDVVWYFKIIGLLKNYGQILTEQVADSRISRGGEKNITEKYIYQRDLDLLKTANILVAEVTIPSLGVGYEIARAELWKKPILCLYRGIRGKKISTMLIGNKYLVVKKYKNIKEVEKIIVSFFEKINK